MQEQHDNKDDESIGDSENVPGSNDKNAVEETENGDGTFTSSSRKRKFVHESN